MSQENLELIRRSNEAFNRGDVDEALLAYHPDVEFRDLNPAPDASETVHGIAALRQVLSQWNQSFGQLTATLEELIDAGDAVVLVTRWRGRGTGTGIDVDASSAEVYEFADGLVVRATLGYATRGEALKAAGLEE